MKVFIFVCIIAEFCVALSMQDTPHDQCDDGPGPLALRVEGCDSLPCYIYKGTNMSAQWDFLANADAKALEPRVEVSIGGISISYPFPEKDACKSLTNGKCPLKKDTKATYNLNMPINKNYPSVSPTIQFTLIDDNQNVQVCFSLECVVTDK
ncbi:NPC intracellular cholesterol transporter 2 [Anoplolepis gracilipes]|uniref:NPC intracellular cholesterol transporter 2 n=1 Tax=Anoplolepis gracilipes TaxID=354296 RepID=UPI003BA3944F